MVKIFSKRVIVSLSVLIVLIAVSIVLQFNSPTGAVVSETETLAKCLTENGAIMYGTSWCGHCNNQKALFGSDFQYITFVDCDENKEQCSNAGIQGYPTWVINNQLYPGKKSLSELKNLINC